MDITLTEIEDAINYWRGRCPSSGEERALSPEVNALAKVYALMIYQHSKSIAVESLDAATARLVQAWRERAA
ncbi:MAG: hypothetical protein JWP36_2175 [Paucimonas sp.]|jgi:hypothetical protein|nr:hypothetical protein [Paucimonas sp.]